MTRFTYELGQAALASSTVKPIISIARSNAMFENCREFGDALFPIETFASGPGAITQAWRIPAIRRDLAACLNANRIQAVIELMPHVWSPFIVPTIRAAGVRYVTIAHDAVAHPGDPTSWVNGLLKQTLKQADLVVTLSNAVAEQLATKAQVPRERLVTVRHPDLGGGKIIDFCPPAPGSPFKLLFLGRILAYKGLPLLLDAVAILREQGVPVDVGVYGEGSLGASEARLKAIDATVVNRWLADEEIATILPQYHAMVLSHTEASQSGVAALSLGAGMPIVATPVGGLVEQVRDGHTGLLAAEADAPSLAAAIQRLASSPQLYQSISREIQSSRRERSMASFVDRVTALAVAI